jgi:hypothetical protein
LAEGGEEGGREGAPAAELLEKGLAEHEEGLCGICAEDEKEKRRLIEEADALFDIPEGGAEEF